MGPLVPRLRNNQLSHPSHLHLRLYTVTIYGKNDNIDEDDDSKDSERTGLATYAQVSHRERRCNWSSSIPARSLELQQKLNQVREGEISK